MKTARFETAGIARPEYRLDAVYANPYATASGAIEESFVFGSLVSEFLQLGDILPTESGCERPELSSRNRELSKCRERPSRSLVRSGYGEVKHAVVVLEGIPLRAPPDPACSARNVARVLASYPDAVKSLLMLADLGPLATNSLMAALHTSAGLEGDFLEMIAELRACGQLEFRKGTLGITQQGTQTVTRLRAAATSKG